MMNTIIAPATHLDKAVLCLGEGTYIEEKNELLVSYVIMQDYLTINT